MPSSVGERCRVSPVAVVGETRLSMSLQRGSPRARAFGAVLRGHRTRKKVGLRELARDIGISHTQLVKYEAGDRVPKLEDLATILTTLGVKDPERARVLDLARDTDAPNWLSRGVSWCS